MNPEAASEPAANVPVVAATIFAVADLSDAKKKWQLAIHPAHLALSDASGGQPYILLREGFPKDINYIEGMRVLSVTKPLKVTLKLTPEATAAVTAWFGDAFLATTYLRRRYGFVLPWAVLWMVCALPLPAGAGTEGRPFHTVDFLLGAALVVGWALAKWRPHPGLFLLDFFWFGWLAVSWVLYIIEGRSKLWVLLVLLLGWMAVTGLKHFIRFRKTVLVTPQK